MTLAASQPPILFLASELPEAFLHGPRGKAPSDSRRGLRVIPALRGFSWEKLEKSSSLRGTQMWQAWC